MNFTHDSNATVSWSWEPVAWEWWEVLQLILALVGMAGNFLVMLVLFRVRKKRSSTDTLIAGLALADFLTSIFITPHAQVMTLPGTLTAQLYCRIIHSSVFMWVTICASIFTLTAISVERYVAVIHPFHFKRLFSRKRTSLIVAAIWIFSIIVNIVVTFVVYRDQDSCVFAYPSVTFRKLVGIAVFLIEYLGPVVVMLGTHVIAIRQLRLRMEKAMTASLGNGQRQSRSHKRELRLIRVRSRIIKMLFIVVVTFIVCWTPDQIFYLALNFGLLEVTYLYSSMYRSFVVLAFVNSCANPIIYAAGNSNFRRALGKLFGDVRSIGAHSIFAADIDSKTSKSQTISELGSTEMKTEMSSTVM